MFSRYETGMHYGMHLDSPIMSGVENPTMRTDLSMTLFLNNPEDYEGGELCIQTDYGITACKARAGDMVIYSSDMFHEIKPITKGTRIVAVAWMQSLVRDEKNDVFYLI